MNNEEIKERYYAELEVYKKRVDEAYNEPSIEKFQNKVELAARALNQFRLAYDEIREPILQKIDFYLGDYMTLKEFIDGVKTGVFRDLDGLGKYANETKETDINIYPSDIQNGMYLKKYTHVVWYNF